MIIMKRNIFINTIMMLVAVLFISNSYAQQRSVSGQVVDSKKVAVIGAAVMVKGTTTGVTTDIDGRYTLSVTGANATLSFSYIGMKSQDIAVGNKTTINVTMQDEAQELEQVVVIGYGAVRKKELTGAVAQVKGDDVSRQLTSDLGNAIQGQISGVNVTSASGAPGESSEILIRGISSISGSNTPLYVVDGIPQEGDPRISSNEIETIDILKDAASCAIYGTRGAAGVILITTKQGKAGAMKVNVTASYGVQQLPNGIAMMNANDQTYFEMVTKRNMTGALDPDISLDLNKRPIYYANDTDLRDVIFESGLVGTQNYSVNLSGGFKGLTYSVVAGYYDTKGMLINTGFNRFNTRANINYKHKKLTLGTSLTMSVENQQVGSPAIIGQSLKYSSIQEQLTPGNTDPIYSDQGNFGNQMNWVAALLNTTDDWKTVKTAANFNIGYEFLPSLNVISHFSLSESNAYETYFKPYQEVYDANGDLLSKPEQSSVQRASGQSSAMTWDMSVNYKKKFGNHSLTLLGVVSTESYENVGFTASKAGVINNDVNSFNSATINPNASAKYRWNMDNTNNLFGALTRVLYDWKSRYMISASVRADASSRFSSANRWGFFPSVSGAWNISEEPFWKSVKGTVNNFKLRLSHGTTGNQNFASYSYTNYMQYGYDALFGEFGREEIVYGATQNSFANPDIKWETTVQNNIGIDLGLWRNKVTITADYYNTDKKDMLFNIPLPAGSGVYGGTNMIMNIGNMNNSGYEFAVTHTNNVKGLWYKVSGTFSTNQNEITELPTNDAFILTTDWGLEGDKVTALAKGYEAGAFFLYKTDGIINTQAKLAEYRKLRPNAQMGDLIYRDVNNDDKITEKDRVYCGSGLPKYEMGLNLNLAYKGFDLYMQWYSALGHEIMNGAKMITYAYGRNQDLVSQWSETNSDSAIPAYRGTNKVHDNYMGYTDLWMEDGSYVRLKNLTLGYSIPKRTLEKIHLEKLRLYLSAQNLLTFTKYSGYNPEIGGSVISRGVDRANYPTAVIYSAGMNLSF